MAEIKQMTADATTIKQYAIVDLVICLDTTGSMSDVIDSVKNNIGTKLIGEMKNQMAKNQCPLNWRGRVIGFGDVTVGEAIYEGSFVNDEEALKRDLQNIPRTGGGDAPESALDALLVASRSPWRDMPVHKVVVLFTDAPAKDLDASIAASGPRDVGRIIEEYTQNRLKLFVYGPRDEKFEKLTAITKATITLFEPAQVHEKLPGMDFSKEFEAIAKTISNGAMDLAKMGGLPSTSR